MREGSLLAPRRCSLLACCCFGPSRPLRRSEELGVDLLWPHTHSFIAANPQSSHTLCRQLTDDVGGASLVVNGVAAGAAPPAGAVPVPAPIPAAAPAVPVPAPQAPAAAAANVPLRDQLRPALLRIAPDGANAEQVRACGRARGLLLLLLLLDDDAPTHTRTAVLLLATPAVAKKTTPHPPTQPTGRRRARRAPRGAAARAPQGARGLCQGRGRGRRRGVHGRRVRPGAARGGPQLGERARGGYEQEEEGDKRKRKAVKTHLKH